MASERCLKTATTSVVHLDIVDRILEHDAMTCISSLKHAKKAMLITACTSSQIRHVLYIIEQRCHGLPRQVTHADLDVTHALGVCKNALNQCP